MKIQRKNNGFTLGEIMMVIAIIGLLNILAIPAFKKARLSSCATITARGFRAFSDGFTMHAAESGQWAVRRTRACLPLGVEDYIDSKQFGKPTPIGGYWRWLGPTQKQIVKGKVAAQLTIVGIQKGAPELLERIDAILDDGNLKTGQMRGSKKKLTFTLE